jgi:hypothetical protein
MIYKKLFLVLLLISFIVCGNSQTVVVKDIEAWTGARIKKQFGDKFELSFEEEFRFEHNISELYEFFTEAGATYSLNNQWKIGLNYRFIRNLTNSGDFESRFRINTDLSYRKKINRLRLSWRTRLQSRNEPDELYDVNNFRNKIAIKYNIRKSKYTPYFSTEVYYRFMKNAESEFNKIRFTLGSDRAISSNSDINFFYRIEKELNEDYPKTTYIIGLRYDFGF